MVAGVCFLLPVSLTASAVITAVEHRGNERQARNQKDLGTKFPEVKDSIAALDVQDAVIDYAASGIMQRIFRSATRR